MAKLKLFSLSTLIFNYLIILVPKPSFLDETIQFLIHILERLITT